MAEPVTLELLGHLLRRAIDRLDVYGGRIDTLSARFGALENRIARLESSVTTLATTFADEVRSIAAGVDRLDRRVQRVEDQHLPPP